MGASGWLALGPSGRAPWAWSRLVARRPVSAATGLASVGDVAFGLGMIGGLCYGVMASGG